MESLSIIFVPLSLVATAAMAASAAIQARRFKLDLFGAVVLGIVTAVGGGSLRDLFLGLTPVFWITDIRFLLTAIPASILSYLLAMRLPSGNGARLALLMYLDAIGLALFTLTGVQVALNEGVSPVLAVVIGCVTGTAGGMIRDLLCNITPSVLKEDLYATVSVIGASAYLLLRNWLHEPLATLVGFGLILIMRLALLWLRPLAPPRD